MARSRYWVLTLALSLKRKLASATCGRRKLSLYADSLLERWVLELLLLRLPQRQESEFSGVIGLS